MTLVDYMVGLLKPYADLPEFTTCILKTLEKLGHPVTISGQACGLQGKKIDSVCDE